MSDLESARYAFRAITAIRPTRKNSVLRDIRRVMTPYLETGESIEVCSVLYSGSLDFGSAWYGTGLMGHLCRRGRSDRRYPGRRAE